MTQMVVPARRVTAPSTTPLSGTLLDVANVSEGVDWLDPDGLYESYNCLRTDSEADLCPEETPGAKTFTNPSWIDGIRFAVYGGVECKAVGFDTASASSNLLRVFTQMESVGVERAIMTNIFTGAGDFDPATDLTPAGGPVDAATGLAILEGYAAQHYAGVPTIHAPRGVGTLLWACQLVNQEGSAYYSKQGSKIASGGGYYPNVGPTGTAPAAGELWMYASGDVSVSRGSITAPPEQMDRATNSVYLLAERLYVASVDCFTAAVRVELS